MLNSLYSIDWSSLGREKERDWGRNKGNISLIKYWFLYKYWAKWQSANILLIWGCSYIGVCYIVPVTFCAFKSSPKYRREIMCISNYNPLHTIDVYSWAVGSWGEEFLLESFKNPYWTGTVWAGPVCHQQNTGFAFLSCSERSECADLFGLYALFLEAGTLSRKLTWKLLGI